MSVRPYSDSGNAERLADAHNESLRYVARWQHWRIWDGVRWSQDEHDRINLWARDTARAIRDEPINLSEDDDSDKAIEKARKAQHNWALASENLTRIKPMVTLAKADSRIAAVPEDFDTHPYLLNCLTGVIDLDTGKCLPHDRALMCTRLAPVVYDEKAKYPRWLDFLGKVFAEDGFLIDYIQRAMGYSLSNTGSEQKLFILTGTGRNGKGTFLRILKALLGDYCAAADFDTTLAARQRTGPRNDVAGLQGARSVVISEVDPKVPFDERLVKTMTGEDLLKARFLNKEFFEFRFTGKLWIACNHKPNIHGQDLGIWRRIQLIPWDVVIPDNEVDPHLEAKLLEELPGILNWALEGFRAWRKQGLKAPEKVLQATYEYQRESDRLAEWMEDCCVIEPGAICWASDLYTSYKEWSEKNGVRPYSKTKLGLALRERGFADWRDRNGRGWQGIGIIGTEYQLGLTG